MKLPTSIPCTSRHSSPNIQHSSHNNITLILEMYALAALFVMHILAFTGIAIGLKYVHSMLKTISFFTALCSLMSVFHWDRFFKSFRRYIGATCLRATLKGIWNTSGSQSFYFVKTASTKSKLYLKNFF